MDIKDKFYQKLYESRGLVSEMEQLDEISNKTKKRYVAHAAHDVAEFSKRAEQDRENNSPNQEARHKRKTKNRIKGIIRATQTMKEEQLDELRRLSDDQKKKLQKRIRAKHDKAWDETIAIRKEKKSAGSADTKKIDAFRNRLGKIHNKLDEAKDSYAKYLKRMRGEAGNGPKDEGEWSKKMKPKQETVLRDSKPKNK